MFEILLTIGIFVLLIVLSIKCICVETFNNDIF